MEFLTLSSLRQLRTDVPRLRVACLDTSVSITQILSHLIQKVFGCEVRTANDGVAAIELVRSMMPDIVFCCIELPSLNGYDVAKAISDGNFKKPLLVALTAYSKREIGSRAKESGFDLLVMKPITLEAIEQILLYAEGSTINEEMLL